MERTHKGVIRVLGNFLKSTRAQDLAEYCLLMAFIALVAAGLMIYAGGGIQGLWSSANTTLQAGAAAAGAAGAASPAGSPASGGGEQGDGSGGHGGR